MFPRTLLLWVFLAMILDASNQHLVPPKAKQVEHMEVRHGETVSDPYFWMREKQNPEVRSYLEAENAYTEAMTRDLKPFQETLYKEILSRIKQTDLSAPVRRGRFYYYSRTFEGQQYPIYCRKVAKAGGSFGKKAAEEILLDQNKMAKGLKFFSLGAFSVSNDDRMLLYSTDTTGFRQYQLFVKDLATGNVKGPLAERVTSAAWTSRNDMLFFCTEDAVTKRSDTVWRLTVDSKPEKVYEEKDPLFRLDLGRTKDRRYLNLDCQSTDSWECRILEADKPGGEFRTVVPREKGHKYDLEHRDGLLYIRTNRDAKNFRVVTAPLSDPAPRNWKPFVEHRQDALLERLELFQDFAVLHEKVEGLNRFRILDFSKNAWHDVAFPEPAYSAFGAGTPEYSSKVFRYAYQSFVTPESVYDYDMAARKATLLKRDEVLGGYDPSHYRSERLWATARDGVKVPISIVYRKGFNRDGKAPLWLHAYGSYGYGSSAGFSHANVSLLDRGLAYAIAHVRGGDDMGEAWHDDGMLLKKKNTFFDFIDCAEFLVKEKWTSKEGLLIDGASAGGLLTGAVTNMRPDLFKAVHSAVPFMDVMNSMWDESLPLTVGEFLEWGNPKDKVFYDYMKSYSPYDNLERKAYPAILVTTSFNDSQVMYWEPAKYVARLRTLKTDHNPMLLKCKMDPAGHDGASGRYDNWKDLAFEYAWMLSQVGIRK